MARAYTVATAALALGTDVKWVDNVLSHFSIDGVVQRRQGIARRISTEAVSRLKIVHTLSQAFKIPIELAAVIARDLAGEGSLILEGGLSLQLDRETAWLEMQSRLDYAVEAAPQPRRGRPPANAKRGA